MTKLVRIRAVSCGVLLASVSFVVAGTTMSVPAVSQTLQMSSSLAGEMVPQLPEAPKPKVGLAFRASELFLAGGTAFDMATTRQVIDHPTMALRADGTLLARYFGEEEGWAGMFGKRDVFTAIAANSILNYGIDRYSRKLYLRGGRWRAISCGTMILKGALNSYAAAGNIRLNDAVDQRIRIATGYRGQIHWAR